MPYLFSQSDFFSRCKALACLTSFSKIFKVVRRPIDWPRLLLLSEVLWLIYARTLVGVFCNSTAAVVRAYMLLFAFESAHLLMRETRG